MRVIHTTDVHGHYSGRNDRGGVRRLAVALSHERRVQRSVLLLDSGDMWSGTLLSDQNEGALGVRLYNALGYDAAALGNHEFDYGAQDSCLGSEPPPGAIAPNRSKSANVPKEAFIRRSSMDFFSALKVRIAHANFPILAANLRDRATGSFPTWANLGSARIIERGGVKIGVIGLITIETPTITFPEVGEGLEFLDTAPVVTQQARALRERGAQLIFVVGHLGAECTKWDNPHDLSSCKPNQEAFELLDKLEEGTVDALFGGHTHRVVSHWYKGVAVIQAPAKGGHIGVLDVVRDEGSLGLKIRPPVALDADPKAPAARVVDQILKPVEEKTQAIRSRPLGVNVPTPLLPDRIQSSVLGNLLCDLLLEAIPGQDICILNSGGIRRSIESGPLLYGDLYDVLPFGNLPAKISMRGDELLEVIRIATSGAHGVLQVAGLRIKYDLSADPCPKADVDGDGAITAADRDRLIDARLADGSAIDPEGTYRVLTSNFLALGGDHMSSVMKKIPQGRIRIDSNDQSIRDHIARQLGRKSKAIAEQKDDEGTITRLIHGDYNDDAPRLRVKATGAPSRTQCEKEPGARP